MQNRPEYCTESRLFNIVSLYKNLLSVYGIQSLLQVWMRILHVN